MIKFNNQAATMRFELGTTISKSLVLITGISDSLRSRNTVIICTLDYNKRDEAFHEAQAYTTFLLLGLALVFGLSFLM